MTNPKELSNKERFLIIDFYEEVYKKLHTRALDLAEQQSKANEAKDHKTVIRLSNSIITINDAIIDLINTFKPYMNTDES